MAIVGAPALAQKAAAPAIDGIPVMHIFQTSIAKKEMTKWIPFIRISNKIPTQGRILPEKKSGQ
jgi:hypothetical protein